MIIHRREQLMDAYKKSGQTDLQVAANAGMAHNTVRRLFEGAKNVQFGTLEKVAEYLGLDVEIRYKKRNEG
jgi:transcriptional regulator with XRE-family HTH domain